MYHAAGCKSSMIGTSCFVYGTGQALIVGLEIPALSSITKASSENPYIGIILRLDLELLRDVFLQLPVQPQESNAAAAVVVPFDESLADCV